MANDLTRKYSIYLNEWAFKSVDLHWKFYNKVCDRFIVVRWKRQNTNLDAAKQWANENCKKDFMIFADSARFLDNNDAVMFKLKWVNNG